MNVFYKHKLTLVTIAYWFLLTYIVSALLWWFIALNNQNNAMATMRLNEINKDDTEYSNKHLQITSIQKRKTAQYAGEGISFLAVIIIGAIFIYRATRKQIKFGQQQQNFMMAITHELKTPIAITQLNLETIQKRNLDAEKKEKIINDSLLEVNRLNNLCNNILWAAQLDSGSYNNSKEEINLSEAVFECVNDFEKRFGTDKIIATIQDNIYFNGDILMLQILVNNLLDNAIKYSPINKKIAIKLIQKTKKIELVIKDEGVGIAEIERKKIFEKFYRTGNESTRNAKGTGLGLYLCKKIVTNHKGEIIVTHNNPFGSIFTVVLS